VERLAEPLGGVMARSKTYGWEWDRFVVYFHFIGWWHLALGVSLWLTGPNIEIHLPFGFVRVGIPQRWREHRMRVVDIAEFAATLPNGSVTDGHCNSVGDGSISTSVRTPRRPWGRPCRSRPDGR
jgi:hypothetical protein